MDTWENLKQELCSQFFLENVEIIAKRKLRELSHTGNIRDYVKQFFGLALDIRDMFEKDKVFSFVEGLKSWVKMKLYEQRVQDHSTPYAIVKRLFDLSIDQHQEIRRNQTSASGENKNYRPNL